MEKIKKRIAELTGSEKWTELESFLLSKEQAEITNTIKKFLLIKDGPFLLNGILKSLQCKTRESSSLKCKIYEGILKLIKNYEDTDDKENGKLVAILIMHVESFPNNVLIKLIDLYMEHLSSDLPFYGRWTELLGKLLSTSISRKELFVDEQEMSGEDFQYHIVKKICGYNWNAETTIALLPILKEIKLPKEELKDVIEKLRKVLRGVDYQSVPPIVYHMILLCQNTFPSTVLEELIIFFNEQETKLRDDAESNDTDEINSIVAFNKIDGNTIDELIEARSTVVHHITDLAKYDSRLTKDYLKIIKCTWLPNRLFTPFNLSLALSLVHIDRYKDNIIDSLKSCILKNYKLEEKRQKSMWLTEVFKNPVNLVEVFRTTVNSCTGGWDQVSEGMVLLCFSLLECVGFKGETFPIQQTVALASAIMPLVFKKEIHLAPNVIKQVSGCIFTTSTSLHYVELLGRIVKTSPVILLDHVNLIRELLEQLAFLPIRVGTMLLGILLPLIKLNMGLKDALIIILRKLLFSKQIENREVAVLGFLQILRHFKVLGALPSSQASMSFSSTLSQVSADIHSNIDNNTNEALCLELLGVLRRCFTQQHEIRSTLYGGLYDVCKMNLKLAPNILQLLHQHLSNFLNTSEDTLNPILLQKTVSVQGETVTLVEPLGELLSCLSKCKSWYEKVRIQNDRRQDDDEDEDEIISILNDICTTFDTLTEKLAYCDMDDLDFNATSFVANTINGRKGLYYAEIMCGVYDALIHQNFCCGALESEDKMKTVLALFKIQKKILDLVKEKPKPGKKGDGSKSKGKSSNVKQAFSIKSILSLDITVQLLNIAFNEDEENNSNIELIKGNYDLQIHLINIIEVSVASLKSLLPVNRERFLSDLKTASHILFKVCVSTMSDDENDDDRELTKFRQCLNAFHSLLVSFIKYFKDKLPQIFKEITGKSAAKEYESLLHLIAKSCTKLLLKILRKENQTNFAKDATVLIQIIGLVVQQMELNSKALNEIQDIVNQICKDQPIDQSSVSEALTFLLLTITDRVKINNNLIRSIGRELHYRLGDIEQDVVVEETGDYKIVTENSSTSVLIAVCNYCDETLSILEISLFKLKESVTAGENYNDEELDRMISFKFAVIIQALHEIFQSAIPHGSSQDIVLKTTTKFYNCLSIYVKYYLEYFKVKKNPQISEKFEKLVLLCSNMLKENAYKMINYVHSTQHETGKKKHDNLAARALKESKLIPALVFSMEEYEKHLLQLAKKSSVNLLAGSKITTARDFRIVNDALEEAIKRAEEEDKSEEEVEVEGARDETSERKRDSEDETEEEREPSPPPKKKRKSK